MNFLFKKASWILLFAFLISFSLENHENVYAAPIPDGGATESRFNPFQVDPNSYNKRWSNLGGKSFPVVSGKQLVYDVYSGQSTQPSKKSWSIVYENRGRGNEPFIQLFGWSAIVGYHNHYLDNQATYIVAYDPKTKNEKMYKTEMRGIDASKDIEYGKKTAWGPITNACSDEVYNTPATTCNMHYDWSAFRALIPLNDLIPDPNKDENWEFYIVKNVEGHVVYDSLILPFDFNKLKWKTGDLTFSSGKNTNTLVMNSEKVIRRKTPRGTDTSDVPNKFVRGKFYTRVAQDESAGAAIWYGVRSPHDNNATRWTSSAYWDFGGVRAVLSYKRVEANVTTLHIDANTNKVLQQETIKRNLNQAYSVRPKADGTFKDAKGNPYIASPANQLFNKVITQDETIRFYYKAALSDPSADVEIGKDTGQSKGKIFWELDRGDTTNASQMNINSDFAITGKHYQTRNPKHSVKVGSTTKQQSEPIYIGTDAQTAKGKNIDYSFSYEYTNSYRDNYKCVDQQGSNCFKWQYVDRTPAWNKVKTYILKDLLLVNHNQQDTLKLENIDEILDQKWIVGKEDTWNSAVKNTKTYYEQWKKADGNESKVKYDLKTQTNLPITPGQLIYEVALPSGLHKEANFEPLKKEKSNGFYFAKEIDDSLKKNYENKTSYTQYPYAFPLQQDVMNDIGMVGDNRQFKWSYVTDMFFLTKNTGVLTGYPYANDYKRHFVEGTELMNHATLLQKGEELSKSNFVELYGSKYIDDVMYGELSDTNELDIEKFQRYYLPVSPSADMHPKTDYKNHIVLSNMGLNDITLEYDQTYSFKNYLFGSGADEALIIEQVDERTKMDMNSPHLHVITMENEKIKKMAAEKEQRTTKRVHDFRFSDRGFVEKVKNLFK